MFLVQWGVIPTSAAAAGTLLLAQKKYHDAGAELEQDFMNPVSIRLLITAVAKPTQKPQPRNA
jgi:hypothetical protein